MFSLLTGQPPTRPTNLERVGDSCILVTPTSQLRTTLVFKKLKKNLHKSEPLNFHSLCSGINEVLKAEFYSAPLQRIVKGFFFVYPVGFWVNPLLKPILIFLTLFGENLADRGVFLLQLVIKFWGQNFKRGEVEMTSMETGRFCLHPLGPYHHQDWSKGVITTNEETGRCF